MINIPLYQPLFYRVLLEYSPLRSVNKLNKLLNALTYTFTVNICSYCSFKTTEWLRPRKTDYRPGSVYSNWETRSMNISLEKYKGEKNQHRGRGL